jgi:potassium/hydrogen antiporter
VLVLFVGIGMLAGSDGIGGIAFEDYRIAHGVGTLALAVILFDGGMRTSVATFRVALAPALSLATVGVLLTAGVTALAAYWLLGLPPLAALLLGSIISSTDAAAVFNVLRSSGVHIRKRLAAILEVESGSNDPMAIFLTVACLELITGRQEPGLGLLWLFIVQMGVGSVVGFGVGKLAVRLINRANLESAGLYPVMTAAAGLLSYGLAATLGGSGFLAVYLAGIVIGNSDLVFRRGTLLYHDAAAWLAQIVMFVMLGLLAFPSRLLDVALSGILIAIILIFVARPLAVVLSLAPFRLSWRDDVFIGWVGLKGAVPIVLATYPLMLGVPGSDVLFDLIFFVVLVSAITQGWSLPLLAKRLRLQLPPLPTPPVTLEITSLKHLDGDIVEYTLGARSRAANRLLRDIRLPDNVVVALIARGEHIVPPRGSTMLLPDDHLFIVLNPRIRPLVDRLFSATTTEPPPEPEFTFPLDATATTLKDLAEFYGVHLDGDEEMSVAEFLEAVLGPAPEIGSVYRAGDISISVASLADGRPARVGLRILLPGD